MEEKTPDKFCENCGTPLEGPYCHACGQKHQEHKHSFFHLLVHFVGDFVHFDAQLFTTLKPLFTKPGLVPKDFVEGRRKRHLDPIRMYVFVSIVFFALFFSVSQVNKWTDSTKPKAAKENKSSAPKSGEVAVDSLMVDTIPTDTVRTNENIDSILNVVEQVRKKEISADKIVTLKDLNQVLKDSVITPIDSLSEYQKFKRGLDPSNSGGVTTINNWEIPKTEKEYLDAQKALPKSERDGWIKKNLKLKVIHINNTAREDESGFWVKLGYLFVKGLPKLLFILLPFFALILKLLYVRRSIYYVDHLIFMIYFFCFLFIVYSISFIVQLTLNVSLTGWVFLWSFFYLYYAMRRFYGQSRFKTLAKFFIFGYLSSIIAMFGATLGALVSVLFI